MRSTLRRLALTAGAVVLASTPLAAQAQPLALAGPAPRAASPSDTKPDLTLALIGYDQLWRPSGAGDLHGTVLNGRVLSRNDDLTVWVNRVATKAQQFRALQDSEYDDGASYDQSLTIADGLGSLLGRYYVEGRRAGKLPLTTALINSTNGTTGAYVSTGEAKKRFSHPRPFLPSDPTTPAVAGDEATCAPSKVNGSSLRANRVGRPWADERGNLRIRRVEDVVDRTHQFSPNDVALSPGYGTAGICTGGSYPSGHTTTAYQAGLTLATLLPETAPGILARTSEAANNRIVLGVHYPLDIVGGRIDGELALSRRWSDAAFRTEVLEPARRELRRYLAIRCGGSIELCLARQKAYANDPYAGNRIPGGTSQRVTDRRSAAAVYRERLTYDLPQVGSDRLAPSVPAGAEGLLRTAFPTLTDAQRRSVLAQTEIRSGAPLDRTAAGEGSWQRLDVAAALSATVRIDRRGSARVVATGGRARVIGHRHHH